MRTRLIAVTLALLTTAALPTSIAKAQVADPWARLRGSRSSGLHLVLSSPSGQLRTARQASELRWVFDRPVIALGDIARQPIEIGRAHV